MAFAPSECLVRSAEKTMMATVFKGVGKPPVFERVPYPALVRSTDVRPTPNRPRRPRPHPPTQHGLLLVGFSGARRGLHQHRYVGKGARYRVVVR